VSARRIPNGVSPAASTSFDVATIERRLAEWRGSRTVGTAADALSTAFVLGSPERAREVAEFLFEYPRSAGREVLRLASAVLGRTAPDESGQDSPPSSLGSVTAAHDTERHSHAAPQAIHRLRARLRDDPRNPIAYVNLARHYTAIGQNACAERAFAIALMLAPESRFILRSATRFLVHTGAADLAQAMLRRARGTKADPWLVAAEIAASTVAQTESRFLKVGRQFLSSKAIAPFHLSELASALGTVELQRGGSAKQARRYFMQALVAPTDNTLAQVEWAKTRLSDLHVPTSLFTAPRTSEARALAQVRAEDWDGALASSWEWLEDEPFSRRSALHGSFIAAVGHENHGDALVFARAGLLANPDDQAIRNNLVYSLARMDRLSDAVEQANLVTPARMNVESQIAWQATCGLLAYRLGKLEEGSALYAASFESARREHRSDMAATAAILWASEALRAHQPQSSEAIAFARGQSRETREPWVKLLLERLHEQARRAAPP
jgi:tetratricopeptide (TPR) repeat protein